MRMPITTCSYDLDCYDPDCYRLLLAANSSVLSGELYDTCIRGMLLSTLQWYSTDEVYASVAVSFTIKCQGLHSCPTCLTQLHTEYAT